MTFGESVRSVFGNYAKFDGRAPRSEYWWFQLFNLLVLFAWYVILIVLVGTSRNYGLYGLAGLALIIYFLAAFIPSIAVTVRRLHDSDKSGWWLLLVFVPLGSLILLVFMVLESTPGPNKYGPPHGISGDVRYAQYRGATSTEAWANYTEDARRASAAGYQPVSQQWRRDGLGDYLEVIYQPTLQSPWQTPGAPWPNWTASSGGHPFDGPPPSDLSAGA